MQVDEDGKCYTTSEEIARQTKQFKARGGKVKKVKDQLHTVASIKKDYDPKGVSYQEDENIEL